MRDSVRVLQGKNYHDESFVLDECVFIDCTFKNCDFFYSGGDHEWANAKFDNCRFHWRGPAKNTFALLQALGILPPAPPPPTPQSSTAVKPPN